MCVRIPHAYIPPHKIRNITASPPLWDVYLRADYLRSRRNTHATTAVAFFVITNMSSRSFHGRIGSAFVYAVTLYTIPWEALSLPVVGKISLEIRTRYRGMYAAIRRRVQEGFAAADRRPPAAPRTPAMVEHVGKLSPEVECLR